MENKNRNHFPAMYYNNLVTDYLWGLVLKILVSYVDLKHD